MRKLLLTISIFSLVISSNSAHTSGDQDNLSKVDRIFYTCKIWGFLKYYHPLVSKGSYNWDEKLVSALKNTDNITTHQAYSDYIARWIYNMGEVRPCTSCRQSSPNELFLKNFDLSWTQNRKFTDQLKKTLKNIERNRFQGSNFYVSQGKIQEFEPKNELPQTDLDWRDEYQRLTPLFRFWNYIEYFYPYKYLTEQSWDDVLKEMIPKFLEANTKLAYHQAMLELIVKVDDSHAGLMTPVLEQMPYYNYLPAKIEMIENEVVVTEIIDRGKAQAQDLQVGDIITKINNRSAGEVHNANKKYIWGSNDAVKDRSIYHTLFMGVSSPVQVTIERGGSARTTSLDLYKYSDITYEKKELPEKWYMIEDSIGYVNMGTLTTGDVSQMMDEMMDNPVIIFDVRNDPKGTYRSIAKYLNASDTTFTIYTKPDYTYPGKFIWQGQANCGSDNPDYYKGLVILLVDENTQSHAEFTCMCLQTAPNVVTVGSQTAGTDGKVSRFPIISRLYTAMSGIGVYYPNKQDAQRVGVTIDVSAERTIDGVVAGRDEILEKGTELAREELERLKEIARLEELARQARLDSLMRLDSMRMDSLRIDSLQMNNIQMDSLSIDSLKVNGDGRN